MKKNLLLSFALAASTMAFAQTNLALNPVGGGTVKATASFSQEAFTAGKAIDGDKGTRWGNYGSPTLNTDYLQIEWSETQTFNTVSLLCENGMNSPHSYKLQVSDNGEVWTDVTEVTNAQTPEGNYETTKFTEQTAKFIRLQGVSTALCYGIYEFEVYNINDADLVLTTIELTTPQSTAKVGEGVKLNVVCKDQMSSVMNVSDITFEVTEGMGTVTDGVYTPTKAGEATIVAKSGDITSNEINITAYAGDKIDIFTNMSAMITTLGEETETKDMVGAFDGNMESTWVLHAGTGDDDDSRTYDTGFVVDLQALYDITALSVTFEGACPADYTISFAGNDGVYGNAHEVTGHAGMAKFTDFFMPESATEIRYVKFLSTKAATQWGIKIFDFSIYGENKQDIPDNTAPTGFTATVVEDAATMSSVTLKLQATDDVSSVISYEISYNKEGEEEAQTVTASGAKDKEITYVLGGLDANTTYNISVVAKDAKGNATKAETLTATTKPMPEAATAPTKAVANVKSIYCDTYGNADSFTLPSWGETTITKEIELATGDKSLLLSNMNYRGLEFTKIDVSDMEYLHVDVYPETANTVTVTPIWKNIEADANYEEIPYAIQNLNVGEWNQIDIPMSVFANDDRNGTNNVYQIKLDNGLGYTFIFDNIYFWKDVANAISNINAETSAKSDVIYNLAGQRVSKATKGVFIINGKKVIIK